MIEPAVRPATPREIFQKRIKDLEMDLEMAQSHIRRWTREADILGKSLAAFKEAEAKI